MRLFPKGGLFGPVAIILTIQCVVLFGSVVVSNDLFGPITKSSNTIRDEDLLTLSSNALQTANRSGDYSPRATFAKSLFPLEEAINSDSEPGEANDFDADSILERDVDYVVARGDTISSLWEKNGAPTIGASKAISAVRNAGLDRFTIKRGEVISMRLNSSGDISKITKR